MDFINYYYMQYCWFDGNPYQFIMIMVIIIFFIFRYVSSVVDEYIADGIEKISDALGLSEAQAAVTLLAQANGAGDVITAIVAGGSAGGVNYNVGALFGAGQFVASFVVALCILQSTSTIVFEKGIIYRDIGFYILSTQVTLCFAWQGAIYYYSAIILLSQYVIYVLVTVLAEKFCGSDNPYSELDSPEYNLHMLFCV